MSIDTVSSEIYSEFDYKSTLLPSVNQSNVVSQFRFQYPPRKAEKDNDGDLEIQRHKDSCEWGTISIEHSKNTALDLVGLQIWRGAFLLADWILHIGDNLSKDSIILELGAGVGFTSIVASMFAPVICTDLDRGEIFKLIQSNVLCNKTLIKHPVKVVELNFTNKTLPEEIVNVLDQCSVIIAADVIYDDRLTDAFVGTIKEILLKSPKKVIYVAIEKRFVFTLADFDTVAPCYEHFINCLRLSNSIRFSEILTDFPQCFQYNRVKELKLLKITSI